MDQARNSTAPRCVVNSSSSPLITHQSVATIYFDTTNLTTEISNVMKIATQITAAMTMWTGFSCAESLSKSRLRRRPKNRQETPFIQHQNHRFLGGVVLSFIALTSL